MNKQTEPLRTNFYDPKGNFLRDKYEAQTALKISRTQFNEFKVWVCVVCFCKHFQFDKMFFVCLQTKKLTTVVDDIARNYNDDLLNMFRLS